MKDLKNLVIFLLSMAYSYIIVSFVLWKFDPADMNEWNRVIVFLVGMIFFFALQITEDSK